MADTEVRIGEIAVTTVRANLVASGVGSCVVITLYDRELKIGAMAHAMLTSRDGAGGQIEEDRQDKQYKTQDTRYVETAIDEMLEKMQAQGTKRKDLEAKIVGGANMFSAFESDIGMDNVSCAIEKLKKEAIKIAGKCVGGSQGRSVEFSLGSGIVTIKTKF